MDKEQRDKIAKINAEFAGMTYEFKGVETGRKTATEMSILEWEIYRGLMKDTIKLSEKRMTNEMD